MKERKPGEAVECKKCGAMMIWTVTHKGKNMPVDVTPDPNGTFYLFRRNGPDGELDHIQALFHKGRGDSLVKAKERGDKLYTPHFKTCPNAEQR